MRLYIVGAGGFGRETLDAAMAAAVPVTAFLDERLEGQRVRGLVVHGLDVGGPGDGYVVAVSDPVARRRLADTLAARGLRPTTIIHPRAVIGPETTLGGGCVVLANAHVSSDVRLGEHVQVNYNATVGHDARLDSFVTVYPGANVSGAVHLAEGASVGSNACVLQGLEVGALTFVGAGAVVTRSLGIGDVAVGVPARVTQSRRGDPEPSSIEHC